MSRRRRAGGGTDDAPHRSRVHARELRPARAVADDEVPSAALSVTLPMPLSATSA
jgi:hypothetical protein